MTLAATTWDWVKDNYSVLAVVISTIALIVSIGNTYWTQRRAARAAKLATYQRLHEALIAGHAAKGRRMLFMAHSRIQQGDDPAEVFPALGSDTWDSVNHALALYDTLGGYVALGLVPEQVVMQGWYHPLEAINDPVQEFMAYRQSLGINQPWSYLRDLLRKVDTYACKCPECPG